MRVQKDIPYSKGLLETESPCQQTKAQHGRPRAGIMFINSLLILVLAIVFGINCNRTRSDKSMFLFFPNSIQELMGNGYKYNEQSGFYTKKRNDTLESIREFNSESGSFSKHFYINRELTRFKDISEDSLQDISQNLVKNATEVIFDFQYHKILKFGKKSFYIKFGYTSKLNYYLIQYYNLVGESNRVYSVENLQNLKSVYTQAIDSTKIDAAINYVMNIDR